MTMLKPRTIVRFGTPALFVLLAPLALASDGKIAIKAGRVITMNGPDIENGVIVIENGKIRSVGADSKTPWDAEVLEEPTMVACPGFVEAHSFRGMDRPNENLEVAPFLDVRDSIDPINFYFEDVLRSGITTINIQQGPQCVIGGQGRVIKPVGLTVEEMTVRPQNGLKIAVQPRQGKSRATQAQALRKAFNELRIYLEKSIQDKKDGKDVARREALFQGRDLEKEENKHGRAMEGMAPWKLEGLEVIPRGEIDEKQEPLLRLVEGRMMAFVQCDSAVSVHLALEIARDNGFLASTVLVIDGDAWKAADLIAEAGCPVVLGPSLMHVERDPVTGKEIETFVPKIFKDKKVRFALQSLNPSAQSLWFQAATCVGYGFERKEAMELITRTPAEFLRLGDRVGSLAPEMDGNVVLFSGDPLSITSTVRYVVLDGNVVYDRTKDVRMRQLMEGVEQPNAAQANPEVGDEILDPHSGKKAAEEDKSSEKPSEKKDKKN